MIPFIPYIVFFVGATTMFALRHRLKFWGEFGVAFVFTLAVAVFNAVVNADALAAAVAVAVPVLFMGVELAMRRGFDKFITNTMMLALAVIPLPWSFIGVLLTVVVVVVYAVTKSAGARSQALNFYFVGANVVGLVRSLSSAETSPDAERMNPILMYLFIVAPTLATAFFV